MKKKYSQLSVKNIEKMAYFLDMQVYLMLLINRTICLLKEHFKIV